MNFASSTRAAENRSRWKGIVANSFASALFGQRARVDKRVFWPQYFRKIEYVCLIGFRLT